MKQIDKLGTISKGIENVGAASKTLEMQFA